MRKQSQPRGYGSIERRSRYRDENKRVVRVVQPSAGGNGCMTSLSETRVSPFTAFPKR